ncbi:MurR/RpiR family transcriptional regulator [Arthrobacter sp. 31Y]|uniref:MurR/RpiR family transcriptional regulator n=1 Tax=Arthrobacter sp. 31Y TaxID=1115632 RepID=UPI0004643854|nr:MurR/RpiR family transcriptional regulator [Arthrobacter sp. 31Y]
MSFKAVVASSTVRLSASEERVMNVLMSGTMSGIPAAEVAERAKTHESTVVRLAKKLGYRGYPDLRNDLRKDETEITEHHGGVMRGDSGYDLSAFVADEILALKRLPHFVPQEVLDAAARTLHESQTIYLFSREDDKPTRDLLARRLRRLGLTTVSLGTTPKDMAERFASFDSNSTLIGLALREAPSQLAALVSEAARRGGKTILLSDVPGYRFRPSPDHLITARRGDDGEYRTQLVPIMLAYSLQLAIFHLDPARYRAARDAIEDLTRLLGGADEIPLRA